MNDKLTPERVTFRLNGSDNKELKNIMETINKKHDVYITKTDLLNIFIHEFFNKLKTENKTITEYLIQYNKL